MDPAVEVSRVRVAYRLQQIKPRKLKALPALLVPSRHTHESLVALDDVSFTVPRGEVLAVVGANGAGKSTLLRLLAKTFRPTSGRVVVRGTVAPILELGAGLDLMAAARDNVLLYGALLGGRVRSLRAQVDEILEWAGVLDFADTPVGAFSSGMVARLAFSIVTAGDPDVVLVDEVLGVGDAAFLERSSQRLFDLKERGCSIVVVSHSADQLRSIATRGILLQRGRVVADGALDEVLEQHEHAGLAPIVVNRD
jgi:ABC-2 type transport system ATP-binding protein